AQLAAALAAQNQREREAEWARRRRERGRWGADTGTLQRLIAVSDLLVRAALLAAGFHQPQQGAWRRRMDGPSAERNAPRTGGRHGPEPRPGPPRRAGAARPAGRPERAAPAAGGGGGRPVAVAGVRRPGGAGAGGVATAPGRHGLPAGRVGA